MKFHTNFKKHVCSDCIKSGDNIHDGIKCEMSELEIDNCIWAMTPMDD